MKRAFIDEQRSGHAVRTLCRALQASASGYYAARSRPPSARVVRQSALATKIREVHRTSRQTYGAPRVHAELTALGVACCRNTVAKLMRREQIVPRAIQAFRLTTDSRKDQGRLAEPGQTAVQSHALERLLAQRCHLHPTREGWLYLAAVLDVYSRAIVGWGMSYTLGGRLAADALEMTINRRGEPKVVHSDRRSTYAT